MSLSLDNRIRTVHVIDPRVDVNSAERHQYGVLSSGNENNFRQFPLNGINNSQISWAGVNPPNENTYVNRRAYKTMTWQLTFIGQSGGAGQTLLQCPGLQPGVSGNNAYYDAPRAYPLANVVQVETVSINGTSFTQNTGLYYAGLARYYNNPDNEDHDQSMTPSMCDQFQTYALGAGFARDPLRGYGDNPLQCPRGGFINCTVLRNDSTGAPGDTAVVQLTATEPFYVSPWLFGSHEEECAFIGVRTMDVNMLLNGRGNGAVGSGLVASLWSHSSASPSTFSSVVANLQSASLLFNYITPDLSQPIPKQVNYSFYQPNYQQTINFTSIAPGANQQFQSNSFNLSSIPNRIYVWIAPNDALYSFTSSDVYYGITQVQILFENRPVMMSQATQQDLYQMSVRNGCNLSWRQWTNDVGSVLCINFGNDFPLLPNQAPGLRGLFNFQITVNATNLSPNTYASSSLNVLFISEGIATISNGTCIQTLGILNPEDVFQAKLDEPVKYKPGDNVYGGAISWSGILGFLKKAARGALDVAKIAVPQLAPQYAPAVQAADVFAKAVGVGKSAYGGKALPRGKMLKLLK